MENQDPGTFTSRAGLRGLFFLLRSYAVESQNVGRVAQSEAKGVSRPRFGGSWSSSWSRYSPGFRYAPEGLLNLKGLLDQRTA